MNHIYKSIFNKALGVFTAVPEFASAHGKGSERTVVGRVAKGTAGFAASALAISLGLALTSTSAVGYAGIYVNDRQAGNCLAINDAAISNLGVGTILDVNTTPGSVELKVPGTWATQTGITPSYYNAAGSARPCTAVGGSVVDNRETQTNRTLFYGGAGAATQADEVNDENNGAKNLTLGGRLDVNSGIIGVGDRGVNGNGATNSIRMGMGTALSDANKQVDAITIGVNAGASAKHATAIGSATTAKTGYSTALGFQSQAGDPAVTNFNGEYATAIGGKAKALHAYTTALGAETNASGAYATAVGNEAKATHESTTAVGKGAKATNDFATAVGQLALASGKNGTAVGTRNEALGEEATAIGYHSHANGSQQLSIGAHAGRNLDGSFSQSTHGISIGSLAGADNATAKSNDDSVLIGTESGRYAQGGNRNTSIGKSAGQYLKGNDNIAMGSNAGSGTATDKLEVSNTVAIGNTAKASGNDGIALGNTANSKTDGAISIGTRSVSGDGDAVPGVTPIGNKSISIGYESVANRYDTIAMGVESSTQAADPAVAPWDAVAIGSKSKATTYKALAIGAYSQATGRQSTVIGNDIQGQNSTASGTRSQILGVQSNVSGDNSVSIGDTNTVASARTYAMGNNINAAAGTDDSLAFGTKAGVGGPNAIALGNTAKASAANTVAISNQAQAKTPYSVALGASAVAGDDSTGALNGGEAAIAIGRQAVANVYNGIAIGKQATIKKDSADGIAIGAETKVNAYKGAAIGAFSEANGSQALAIGNNKQGQSSVASGERSQVIGVESTVSGNNSVAIGDTNNVASERTYAMGNNITTGAGAHDSLAFGTQAYVGNASAIAMGNAAKAVGKEQVSIGKNAGADSANPEGNYYGVYIGSEAGRYQQGDGRNYAIGQNAGQYVKGSSNIALGTNAGKGEAGNVIDASSTIAIGRETKASGYSGISIGTLAETTHANSIALGDKASATNGHDALAVGAFSKTTAAKAMSIGSYSTASGAQSIVIASNYADSAAPEASNRSTATAARAIVMGPESHATAEDALAIGNKNTVASARTYAIGNNINVAAGADDSLAFGTRAAVGAANTVAIGANANAAQANSVALGAGSATSAPHTGNYTLNTSYTAAGQPNAANGTVSVGSAGKERQIQNVAAGVISATSTDAINGSQLHATNNYLSNLAGGVKNVLGGDAAVDNAGNLTMSNIGDTGEGTVHGAIKNLKDAIDSKVDTTASVTSENQADIKVDKEAPVGNTTNYKLSLGDDAKAKLAKAATALQTVEGDSNITATKDATDPTKVKLALNKNLTADSVTLGDKAGDHAVVNKDGLTIANGPSVKKDGINAGDKKITGVADGNVAAGSKDAVNGGQLAEVKAKADSAVQDVVSSNPTALTANKVGNTVTLTPNFIAGDLVNADGTVNTPATADEGKLVSAKTVADALKANHFVVDTKGNTETGSEADAKVGSGNKVTFEAGNNLVAKQANTANGGATVKFSLKDDISLNSVTAGTGDNQVVLGNDGVKVGGKTYINNDGLNANSKVISNVADGVNPNDAVNKSQLDAVKGVADSAVKSVDTVASEENLVVDNNDPQNPKLRLKKAVNLTSIKLDGATPGNTTYVSGYGLTIEDGPSVKKEGINAGDKKITNVAAGDVSATSKDAVNGGQLHNVATSVTNVLGGNAAVDGNGNVTSSDIGGTGANTVDDAIKAVNATAAKHTTVVEGKNVKVTKGKNAAGGDEYTVATKDDLDVTSVTAGNTTVNTNGLTITGGPSVTRGGIDAGNAVITNVRDGKVEANSKDAVNGGQLHATNTKLDGVKAKADTAVQDVKSGDENALTAVKDPSTNIVTVTPKLSGDLVDANGNITAPTTAADKGKLVTAGTVAQALANTHFVVDTKATDGELDTASQADQKIKAGNKVTLQAGKNLKAKQTNGANGAQVEFSLKDSISLTEVTAGDSTLNTDGLTIAGGPSVKKDGINAGDKTITNVAPGAVTPTSKDAVNGSQLYNVADNVKDLIGPDATIDPATGKVTVADPAKGIGETGKGTIGEAIKSVKDKADTAVQDIKSGDEKALSVTKAGNTYTITPNLSGDLVDANGNITAPTTPADKGKLVTAGTVADALANTHFVVDTKATDGELDAASQADQKIKASNKVTLQAGKNLKAKQTNGTDGAQVEFSLKDSISLTQVTAGDSTLNTDGLTITGGPSVKKDGIDAGNKKITGVADGNVAAGSTDAVNGGQLAEVKSKADSAVQNVVSTNPTALTATKVGDTVRLTPNFIAGDLVNADGSVNTPAAGDEGKLVSAKAVADALKANHFVVDTKGNTETGSEADAKVGSSNKVTFEAGKNLIAKQANTANGGATVKFSLQDDISLNSVTAGTGDNQVVLGNDGVKVGGNTYINNNGLNANDKKITNVAPGAVTPTSKDAVNGSQLYNVANNVKNLIGSDATIDPATGKVTVADPAKGIAGTGKTTIGEAIQSAAAAANTKVKAGTNIEVGEVTNKDGSKTYTVSTAKDLTVDSVKAGDTTVDKDGLTIAGGPSVTKAGINAGGNTITNVADGVNPNDAVNKGQLDKVAGLAGSAVQDIKSGDEKALSVTKAGNTYTITPNLIGELVDADGNITPLTPEGKGKLVTAGTVAQALENTHFLVNTVATAGGELDAASQADQKIKAGNKVTFQAGKNLKAKQTNGANGTEVEFSLQDNVTVKTVNTDNVKANNGIEIVDGPSMTKDGINAAGKAISNVANGNVAKDSKDAVNGGQLHETAQSVADVIGGGATVKDGKVVAGKNGIGNTGQNTVHGAIAAINQNTANNFNQIRGDLRKMDRDLRGGIAGALATAGLPQAFRPGKSMVAAAASTYRGQSGLAIGVSRISDNGKVILKVTGNTNSRGDFGGTIGAGYQW